ncbi:TadE family type IV pilus minor pilin [Nocardia huaxiensis]|uniref:Pilus assembly protein TadE n=1 Tax=Nocardia huaxiensis TaxID=2755382 RepID=A0A7D6ZJS8_9NOCA|nr:TadE family type IV pilus minor pilin [Nocardia huaxiensis]QLY31380.1 pilus assembly protein TadE [Nocardia huaxiensis]UFS94925.1 pilus assembly protein TadE [Nocardia huaxiensis]
MATVEAALALAALVAVLVLGAGVVLAASAQVRCVDAAREAARLTARGDEARAVPIAREVAPPGAVVTVRTDRDLVIAVVTARAPLLSVPLRAEAVAAREPEETR